MRLWVIAVVLAWMAVSACGDPGYTAYFANPCDQPIGFVFKVVEVGDYEDIGLQQVVTVGPGDSEGLGSIAAHITPELEVLITVEGLPVYEERWSDPRANDSRTFTFDRGLCDRITGTGD